MIEPTLGIEITSRYGSPSCSREEFLQIESRRASAAPRVQQAAWEGRCDPP